eukprot:1637332-Pyramimonas_sp.AAC.2
MEMMGAEVTWAPNSVTVKGTGKLKGVDVNMNKMPDAAMTLAVAALFAEVRCDSAYSTLPLANVHYFRRATHVQMYKCTPASSE